MWEEIARDMQMPWRAVEAQHWILGSENIANRAGVAPFPARTTTMPSAGASRRIATYPGAPLLPSIGHNSPPASYGQSAQNTRMNVSESHQSQYYDTDAFGQRPDLYSSRSDSRHLPAGDSMSSVSVRSSPRRGSTGSAYASSPGPIDTGGSRSGGRAPFAGAKLEGDRLPPIQVHRGRSQDARTRHGRRQPAPYHLAPRSTRGPTEERRRSKSEGTGSDDGRTR